MIVMLYGVAKYGDNSDEATNRSSKTTETTIN